MNPMGLLAIAIAALVAIIVAVFVVVGITIPLARALAWFLGQLGRFVIGEITDALRLVGALITALALVPLTLLCVLIGRWSAAAGCFAGWRRPKRWARRRWSGPRGAAR